MEVCLEAGTLTLYPEARSFTELLRDGRYTSRCGEITEARFPLDASIKERREIVFLRFPAEKLSNFISTQGVLLAARQLSGIIRPTATDCLRFGVAHPQFQELETVVFLHEPVESAHGPEVLCLSGATSHRSRRNPNGQARRSIAAYLLNAYWSTTDKFAFVRVPN